jgi:hypothetical protein
MVLVHSQDLENPSICCILVINRVYQCFNLSCNYASLIHSLVGFWLFRISVPLVFK